MRGRCVIGWTARKYPECAWVGVQAPRREHPASLAANLCRVEDLDVIGSVDDQPPDRLDSCSGTSNQLIRIRCIANSDPRQASRLSERFVTRGRDQSRSETAFGSRPPIEFRGFSNFTKIAVVSPAKFNENTRKEFPICGTWRFWHRHVRADTPEGLRLRPD